jgi:hypothetical protein
MSLNRVCRLLPNFSAEISSGNLKVSRFVQFRGGGGGCTLVGRNTLLKKKRFVQFDKSIINIDTDISIEGERDNSSHWKGLNGLTFVVQIRHS